jgi:hypothetical protein
MRLVGKELLFGAQRSKLLTYECDCGHVAVGLVYPRRLYGHLEQRRLYVGLSVSRLNVRSRWHSHSRRAVKPLAKMNYRKVRNENKCGVRRSLRLTPKPTRKGRRLMSA